MYREERIIIQKIVQKEVRTIFLWGEEQPP